MKPISFFRDFFALGVQIIGNFPAQIQNGQAIDAVPMMAILNFIQAQVNANAQPVSSVFVPTYVATVGGTANAITLTPAQAITSYLAGQRFSFIPLAPNTGATTINVSGLGARNLRYPDGTAMSGGELLVGGVYDIEDNGAAYVLMNSAQGSGVVAFTPTLSFGGAAVGLTYALQSGIVCKVGRMVFGALALQLATKGASVGQAVVGALPYAVNGAWLGNNAGPCVSSFLTFAAGYCTFGYQLGTTNMTISNVSSAAAFTLLTDAAFANNTLIAAGFNYAT